MSANPNPINSLVYPISNRIPLTEDYHGIRIDDPYRWLEDDNSDATKNWVTDQNKVTEAYLSGIPFRNKMREDLERIWNYPKYSAPFKKGDYYFFFKNDGLQNQAILYRQRNLEDPPEVLLDPNTLDEHGVAALGGLGFSRNGIYMAYSIAVAGSDWQEVYILETATGRLLPDKIEWVKFSGFSWQGEDGFYYSGYDKPDERSKLSQQNQFHKVFYHRLGSTQKEDKLVFEDREHPLRYHSAALTEDERFLILSISEGTSGAEIKVCDKGNGEDQFKLLVAGFDTESAVVDNDGDQLLVKTNESAANYRVVLIDPSNPARENWKTIIPERKEALQDVGTAGGQLFAGYLHNAATMIVQSDYDGKNSSEIGLPGIGTASGFGAEREDKEFFYVFNSFDQPPSIYRYAIDSRQSTLFRSSAIQLDTSDLVTEQVFFSSKDGTRVPIFLMHKKGLKKDGNNPLLLYGYGGFNVPVTPAFSIGNAFFVKQGGIYAVVNLRGGSEYGEEWHEAGMLEKKQNVFDDFIWAAEFLIREKYTNSSKMAMRGGSNGGLLVGAVMVQRPELFRVALPAVGVLDMLRYHKFTVGWGWVVEYGNPDLPEHFPFLHRYSPYHNLRPGVNYPATMITTADHDDRVVPAHSFKFAARLQEYHRGPDPVIIRIDVNAGHGAGKPTNKVIDEAADTWSFVFFNLGMSYA